MAGATLVLQVLTLVIAAAGPYLAYRYARKLSLSGNRQAWLDGLRQDVAELVAVSDTAQLLFGRSGETTNVEAARELGLKLQTLRVRIALRLRSTNERHHVLKEQIEEFLATGASAERDNRRQQVLEAAEAVIQIAWGRILAGS